MGRAETEMEISTPGELSPLEHYEALERAYKRTEAQLRAAIKTRTDASMEVADLEEQHLSLGKALDAARRQK